MTLHHLLPTSAVELGACAGKEDARLIQAKVSLRIVPSDKALQLVVFSFLMCKDQQLPRGVVGEFERQWVIFKIGNMEECIS